MTKSFLSLQTIVMAACLLSFAPAHAQESSKIAFVSTERIFREAAPAKAAQTKLEAEFAKRDRDLQDMAARLKAQS
ncbi:OmpH family outer membrane protein, partial [Acinetobacter baumannii]